MRFPAALFAVLPLLLTPALARAHEPGDKDDHDHDAPAKPSKSAEELAKEQEALEVVVHAEKPGSEAASRVEYGRRELELRPRLRPGDILEAVPGLFAVQHAGGGKANQYFLRGFDADHGTDVAFSVDGVPVNMVSHGHGQGFSDFHFLIPELVVGLEGYKGPYYAHLGDFATAGAVNLRLAEKLDESYAQFGIGQYGIMRGLVIESPDLGDDWRLVAAAELAKDDGPFKNPEQLKRLNVYVRATHDLAHGGKVQMTWMSYGSSWNGSGQIPARAVCDEGEPMNPGPSKYGQPCIDRFGYVDPTEGGATQRHMAQLSYGTTWHDADFNVMAYFIKYDFRLYSNFTFFADDPTNKVGDEIEQVDSRALGGLDARFRKHYHYKGGQFTTTVGAQVRFDAIDNALYHDRARERLEARVKSHVNEGEIGVYVEEDVRVRRWLRVILGARAQRVDVAVDDQLEDKAKVGKTSGAQGAMLFLPKAMAVVSPIPQLDLFADWGRGFHSNDARGVVLAKDAATLMTPATGWEVGARVKPVEGLEISAAGFILDLASELVWAGDAGNTEAAGQTRRYGLELGARYRLKNWLFADAEATFTHARYRGNAGNGDAVALAPTRTFSAGVGARPTFGDFTPFADIRVKSIGPRPATEDGSLTAEGFTVVDANAGLRWKRFELGVDIQNLFNAKWREVQFATTTRLAYEPKAVTGIHYSPGWPFTAIGRATVYWK